MQHPSNPTPAELLEWAYDPDTECEQDFDLVVATPENAELLLRVADDDQCPNQLFFLDCLYRLVGTAAATEGRFMSESQVRRLVARGASGHSSSLRRWADVRLHLLQIPTHSTAIRGRMGAGRWMVMPGRRIESSRQNVFISSRCGCVIRMGIDPAMEFDANIGRPITLVRDGAPIRELFRT